MKSFIISINTLTTERKYLKHSQIYNTLYSAELGGKMKGFLIQLHKSIFAVLLFLIGTTLVTAGMTKYLTNQEITNQLILKLSHMTLRNHLGVSRK